MDVDFSVLGERNVDETARPKKKSKKSKTIEQTYQKLTQVEHILKRPDTYIGSTELSEDTMMPVVDSNGTFTYRSINYVPGLYKIFDEILGKNSSSSVKNLSIPLLFVEFPRLTGVVVNAADNRQRDASMDVLKVVIDREENMISVYNTGAGIPVEMHQEQKLYVPQLVFGELLAGSNFDDDEEKVTFACTQDRG